MEGNISVDKFIGTSEWDPQDVPEENTLILNQTNHSKVFILPNTKSSPRKLIAFSFLTIFILLISSSFIVWASVYTPSGKASLKITFNKTILLNYFHGISNSKTISGLYVLSGGKSNEVVGIIQKIAGVSPGIITTQMPDYLYNDTEWTSFVDEVIYNWNNRHLVSIVWEYENPLTSMSNFTDTSNKDDAEKRWRDLINDEGTLNKVWKIHLDRIAPYLHILQTAGVVPIFDILPIMNDRLFIWRNRPGMDGSGKLYRITRDYLTKKHNLTSLIWSWSLDVDKMTHFEEYWPGSDYVDVASVYIVDRKELPMSVYERLINFVGDKPMSMEYMYTAPSLELLTAQPRWTWFTAVDEDLKDKNRNTASNIKATFRSASVINRGSIGFFNDNF